VRVTVEYLLQQLATNEALHITLSQLKQFSA